MLTWYTFRCSNAEERNKRVGVAARAVWLTTVLIIQQYHTVSLKSE